MTAPRRRRRSGRDRRDVKDRLVQTRVPERLEHALKAEAQKRRLTVSHLIRNMLEDTFELVDTVVAGATDIAEIAGQVARDAGKIASNARQAVRPRAAKEAPGAPPAADGAPAASDRLASVLAWNEVIANQGVACARCGDRIPRGARAHLGIQRDPAAAPVWLCAACLVRAGSSK